MRVCCVSCPKLHWGSKVVYEDSVRGLSSYEKEYIDRFEEGDISDLKYLGEGVTSKAYFSESNDFVIKKNKDNPFIPEKHRYDFGSLGHEYRMLSQINPNVKTTQRSIAYVETEKGGRYLLSTFVPGKPANYENNPFSNKHIDSTLPNSHFTGRVFSYEDLSLRKLFQEKRFGSFPDTIETLIKRVFK